MFYMQGPSDILVVEDKGEFYTKEIVNEELPQIGASVEIADGSTANEGELELYQWRLLRQEQDEEYAAALIADQAKVKSQ